LAFVGAPNTFSLLKEVNYAPFSGSEQSADSSQVTLTDTTGTIATGVSAIRFSFLDNSGSGQVFREIDVTGMAVPERSVALTFVGGGAALLGWRRRRG
jgi:hypothetical protein